MKTAVQVGLTLLALCFSTLTLAASVQERAALLKKLDMLDRADFEDLVNAANNCTAKRNFSCTQNKLKAAKKLARYNDQRSAINSAWGYYNSEKQMQQEEHQARLAYEREMERLERERRRAEDREDERRSQQAWADTMQRMSSGYQTEGGAAVSQVFEQHNREMANIVAMKQQQRQEQLRQEQAAREQAQRQRRQQQQAEQRRREQAARERERQQAQQQARLKAQQQARQQVAASSSNSSSTTATRPTQVASAKQACVARGESIGPMPHVPKQYCNLVFADYTGNTAVDWKDYRSEFNAESGSLEHARKGIQYPLLEKAKKQCKSRGYDRVHHPNTYAFNEVDYRVTDCKENNRMGSTFHLCIGTASFICARKQ